MSNCLTWCIGSYCPREDLLWKYNQTALQRYRFDKNFQMRRKILIQFSAQVVWARKQSCEAASLKKTISRTFAAAVGVEQESFVNWKAWRESLFQTVPLSSARVFSFKMLSLETNALGLLYSVFNQSLVFRLVGWSRWSCLNRRMHLKTLEICNFYINWSPR